VSVDETPGPRGASNWLALIGWILLSGLAGALGGIASINARQFYESLVVPSWAPPGWLFGPVWTVLYVLMGIAAWMVWRIRPTNSHVAASRRTGLILFIAQLVLNALWTWLFFAWRQGAMAFVEIVLLWIVIALTMLCFARVRRAAAWCLVPYLAWVSFATALTWAIWRANPGQLN
jgi:tryptophan-rich sensory protein